MWANLWHTHDLRAENAASLLSQTGTTRDREVTVCIKVCRSRIWSENLSLHILMKYTSRQHICVRCVVFVCLFLNYKQAWKTISPVCKEAPQWLPLGFMLAKHRKGWYHGFTRHCWKETDKHWMHKQRYGDALAQGRWLATFCENIWQWCTFIQVSLLPYHVCIEHNIKAVLLHAGHDHFPLNFNDEYLKLCATFMISKRLYSWYLKDCYAINFHALQLFSIIICHQVNN